MNKDFVCEVKNYILLINYWPCNYSKIYDLLMLLYVYNVYIIIINKIENYLRT